MQAVIKFLPIFEKPHPDDFAHMVRPPENTEDGYVVGHLEYHPAVYEFVRACYENGFVQSFDWVIGELGLMRLVDTCVILRLSDLLGSRRALS